jgi:hypothetical protein
MSTRPQSRAPDPNGLHVATIAHDGLLWETYLELDDDPHRPASFLGRLRFDVAGAAGAGGGPTSTQTTVIIIEDSYEAAVAKARAMDDRVLESLLRSALPNPG